MRLSVAAMALLTAGCVDQSLSVHAFQSEFPEYGLVEGPDGYYLTRQDGEWGAGSKQEILRFARPGSMSSRPPWAESTADESDFFYSRQQEIGCFVSDRPSEHHQQSPDIWCVNWLGDRWDRGFRQTTYSPSCVPDRYRPGRLRHRGQRRNRPLRSVE